MSDFTRGQPRENLTFVQVNPIFLYGWKTVDLAARTGVSNADLVSQLGHLTPTAAQAIANRIMVTGANSPKPARVVKRDRTAPISQPGSTSTFLAFDRLAAATTAGWTLAKAARGVRLTANVDGRRSITAVATLSNGALYCFPLNRVDFERAGTTLGLQSAQQINTVIERRSLVTGSRTKPGRASIEDSGGLFTTFFSTGSEEAVVAAGYNIERPEFIEFAAASGGG